MRGEERELIGFIGFQAYLIAFLDRVDERFDEVPTVDKLQQEFYLLAQERMKKTKDEIPRAL